MRSATEAGILGAMHSAHVYQILNHYTPKEALDPGFGILDNSSNERPDWFEYWPIRKFLLNEPLDEHAFYGFLSPKFKLKTSLHSGVVDDFIRSANPSTDVVLFSPSIHNSAYYWNVFEHGDAEHPGLKAVAAHLFERLAWRGNLDDLVSDSRNTVHSNYFIAKPRFWRAWLTVNERMFEIAEAKADPLGESLRAPTSYRGGNGVQMKIFVMERVASWLLSTDPSFSAQVRDPFVARTRIYKLPIAIACDALKIAYATQARRQYKDVFMMLKSLRKFLNFQIRLGGALGLRRVKPHLRTLESYWLSDER